jgi:hypothetical protein
MKILVACEYSGTVRDAFRKRGHDAWSCDILPTDVEGPHFQCDVTEILDHGWDLMIAHPPCTYLAVSGMHWTTRGFRDPKLTLDALDFVLTLLNAKIPKIALENPVSVISTHIRKPDQIIHPWMFGHDYAKKTCLWLKNLPKLKPDLSKIIPPAGWKYAADKEIFTKTYEGVRFFSECPESKMRWANQTPAGQDKLGPSPDRWKIRSKTFQGIADAMAEQWSELCN